ncbi:PilW family protein [Marinobacter sp. CHS3-4]|uniref:PilW family protein n=1 Tax=Marinobacter sp. CHS3-4 TaxID=3045174 RepID=UPI0024B4AE8F|nr:PilW family protein [Marinobacter sp. CHS3-4]MDI9246785.1 PilW family protein [Marinobacter sp. CHS3-4]
MYQSNQKPYTTMHQLTLNDQRGLSLVELMVAIALGLILTLGVTQIYLSGNSTYRQTQGFAHAQESTRFVASILNPDLRSAGTFGCLSRMGRPLDQIVDNRLNGGLSIQIDRPLQGWEYTGTSPGDSFNLPDAIDTPGAANWSSGTAGANLPASLVGSVITGSDVIITNAMATLSVPVDPGNPQNGNSINFLDNVLVPVNRVVLATDGACSEGELFQKSNNYNSSSITMAGGNVNPGNNGNNFNIDYEPQTRVYEFTAMAYYIGEGTNGEPALFRRLMTPLEAPQELVSGVETLQILYGVNTNGSNAADEYVPADEIADDDWANVVSIRFATISRSQNEVLVEENTRTFDLIGSEVSQGNDGDRRARIASSATVALRGVMQ